MFKLFKKKSREEKKSKIDKLIMGMIVGGAIGSVIGMSIAPNKGKETREYLNKKSKEILQKGQEISDKVLNPDTHYHRVENKGIFKKIIGFKNILLNRFKFKKDRNANAQQFRQIPNEHFEEDKTDIIKF